MAIRTRLDAGALKTVSINVHDALVSRVSCRAWADDDYKSWCDEMERRADIMITAIAEKKMQEKPKLKKVMGGKK